jgi:serine/threonine protein kinase
MDEQRFVFWRNGMLFKIVKSGVEILLEYNPQLHKLEITAKQPLNSVDRSFAALLQAVETLLESYYSPEIQESESTVKRWIPCSHCWADESLQSKPALFAYQDLVKAIRSNVTMVNCANAVNKTVLIDYTAPDIAFSGIPIIQPNDLEVGERIGSGGFGIVYKGLLHNVEDHPIEVAIKELNPPKDDQEYLEKFEEFKREAFIMSSLNHKNLVKLYGITVSPKLSMVMEYVRGGDLHHKFHAVDASLEEEKAVLKKDKKKCDMEWKEFMQKLSLLSEQEKQTNFASFDTRKKELDSRMEVIMAKQRALDENAISWRLRYKVSLDIANGVKHLHSIVPPIVHRDLRSPNVFLVNLLSFDENATVNAKVADFGLSRQASPKLGEILPTWQWLAPEIIDPSNVSGYDEKSDVYSFGIVAWEIATQLSEAPFSEYMAERDRTVINKIINEGLRPTIPESCPTEYANLIKRCWHPNPKQRPSFEEIADELNVLLGLPSEMEATN